MTRTSPKILLIEGNPLHEGLLGDVLEDSGYELRRAADVPQAIEIIGDFKPDLFLLDLVTQGDDYAVIEWAGSLRADWQYREVPILFVTAYAERFQKQIDEIPLTQTLAKPFSLDDAKKAIRASLSMAKR